MNALVWDCLPENSINVKELFIAYVIYFHPFKVVVACLYVYPLFYTALCCCFLVPLSPFLYWCCCYIFVYSLILFTRLFLFLNISFIILRTPLSFNKKIEWNSVSTSWLLFRRWHAGTTGAIFVMPSLHVAFLRKVGKKILQ